MCQHQVYCTVSPFHHIFFFGPDNFLTFIGTKSTCASAVTVYTEYETGTGTKSRVFLVVNVLMKNLQ
jgi:hypothetical protein